MAAGDEGPSGLWSICVSGDRCGDAVGFSLSKGGNATDAGKRKGIGRKSRGNSCQRKHPAEILALGPSCASHRRSSNANSLCGRNSAGSPEICATFQRDILRRRLDHSEATPAIVESPSTVWGHPQNSSGAAVHNAADELLSAVTPIRPSASILPKSWQ